MAFSFFIVVDRVFCVGHDLQVFDCVVNLVFVYVVYDFIRQKIPTYGRFHDVNMLSFESSGCLNFYIPF